MRNALIILSILAIGLLAACDVGGLYGGATATPTEATTPPPAETATPTMGTTPEPAGQDVAKVDIADFAFDPETVTIKVGDSVEWTNRDSATHTVNGPGWDSPNMAQGDTFTHQFTEVGTFTYICGIHPNMVGTVVVE